jgi:hypothetical protein
MVQLVKMFVASLLFAMFSSFFSSDLPYQANNTLTEKRYRQYGVEVLFVNTDSTTGYQTSK